MRKPNLWCRRLLVFVAAALTSLDGRAAQETVDRLTQTALALDAHPDRGAVQFLDSCARCHGAKGQGDAAQEIPSLAGQRFNYLVRQLANFAGGERDSAAMHRVPRQDDLLRKPRTWVDIAAYLNNAPMRPAHPGDGAHVALGRGIFHEQCASCHRADAHGDGDGFVPSLRNQHYTYLVSQLEKLAEGYRHNVDEDLVRFWRGLDEEDVRATADYLSRLAGPGKAHKAMRRDGTVVD